MKTNSLTRIFLTCLMGVATCSSAMAQTVASGAVTIDNVQTNVENKRVDVAFRLNLNNLKLKAEQQLILTPLLAADGDTTALQPIIINGRSQQIRMQRAGKLNAKNTEGEQPIVVLRKNGTEQSISYSQSVERMRPVEADQLQVLAAQDLCGCGDLKNQDRTLITTIDNLGAWMPALAFVKPAAEARKQRAEKGEAYLSFCVNKTDIVVDLFDNSRELAKITKTIDLVREDKNVQITGINIHGFASPDGPYANNERLARERAASLNNYVANLYPINAKLFSSNSTPEDWDGFRRKVQQSNLANKEEIIKISNSSLAPDDKDKRIRQLYPHDYAVIMSDIYPRLRHSDYTVSYTVRPFSVEEAKQILKTRPQQLSLQEMFLVAQTMEVGSKEFNEVFDIAVRMFPDDPTANLNAACADIQRGDMESAERHLKRAGNSAEANNARGALAVARKNYKQAKQLFDEAAVAGSAEAKANAKRIERIL